MHTPYLDDSLDLLVTALCKDYKRRKEAALNKQISHRVEIELKYINAKIYDAVSEVVGERICEDFIAEIGNAAGYARTEVCGFSESTYKIYKRRCKENIAKRLHLI